MLKFKVLVSFADGDNWSAPHQFSEVEVLAASPLEAKLVGEQMAYTPQPGKPAHVQVTGSSVSVAA